MPTIFDFVNANEMVSYWETLTKDRPPYLGETLFPAQKKLGLDLKWIKGSAGLPVVLKPSAFDAGAVPRPRIGFDRLTAEMPFFKESLYIDEELRQQLNMVMETGNQAYIDAVLNRIFNDNTVLLEGAAARREQMRMMALTTGAISITANGQAYSYDYGMPSDHKVTVTTSWSDVSADIGADIVAGQDKIEDDTGVRPTRAVCSRKTWGYMLKNDIFKKSIYVLSQGQATLTDSVLKQYLQDTYGLEVVVYSKRYNNDSKSATKYVPDDTFVMFPSGSLGTTWFGTTPEESDLMGKAVANVSITDVGVAVTSINKADPVNVETKVTMISLPSFEAADQVYILDVTV
nr:MAG TPA: Major capsid protein [Caudoviricetes sp.]